MIKVTSFRDMECPVARSLEEVGEWWSILILRDAFHGLRRFDAFEASLGMASSTLARRLSLLVEHGMLARRRYSERPPRDEYVLTEKGRDFYPVLLALMAWGNRHLADPNGPAVWAVNRDSGAVIEPVLIDAKTGQRIQLRDISLAPGPTAGPEIHQRMARAAAARQARLAEKNKEPL